VPGGTKVEPRLSELSDWGALQLERRIPVSAQTDQEKERNRARLTSVKLNQWLETARSQARSLLADFGLTPQGRQGVDVLPPPSEPSPWDRFMEGRSS